jgi:hypothetical protein
MRRRGALPLLIAALWVLLAAAAPQSPLRAAVKIARELIATSAGPFEALSHLDKIESGAPDAAATLVGSTAPEVTSFYEQLAEVRALARDYEGAVRARESALEAVRRDTSARLQAALLAHVALVDALVNARQYDNALQTVKLARQLLKGSGKGGGAGGNRLPTSAAAGLDRVHAHVFDCAGKGSRQALRVFAKSLNLTLATGPAAEGGAPLVLFPPPAPASASFPTPPSPAPPKLSSPAEVKLARDLVQLLVRSLAEQRSEDDEGSDGVAAAVAVDGSTTSKGRGRSSSSSFPPPTRFPQASLKSAIAHTTSALIAHGPWENADQLPRTYLPGLASRPFHSVGAHYPRLAPVVAALEAAAPALRAEYEALRDARKLLNETECIHDASSGQWVYFTPNGHWVRDADDDGSGGGCSRSAPVACALFARVRTILAALPGPRVRLQRGGYSAVTGKAQLRPHWGITNAQLKFHLGLVVPQQEQSSGARPCATLTVGRESRAWEEGKVLFFDDSYVHSVRHDCNEERVVFQLVISHPDGVDEADDPVQRGGPGGH